MRLSRILFFVLACASLAAAQDARTKEANDARKFIFDEMKAERAAERLFERAAVKERPVNGKVDALAVTDAEVGEADSFNKNAKFFGVATTGGVYVAASCAEADLGFPLGPDDRCLEVTDPNVQTSATFTDLGRIQIPGKKIDNVLYGIANHSVFVSRFNGTAAAAVGNFIYTPSVTIESDALNDPAAIDPNTNLPMNGSFTTTGFGSMARSAFMQAGQFEDESSSYTRAGTRGFSRNYWAAVGLPQSVINELYKRPMTIRLNVRVSVRRVEYAQAIFSIRFLAN